MRKTVSGIGADKYRGLAVSILADLLALQKTDIALHQARHRLAHLVEIDAYKNAVRALDLTKRTALAAKQEFDLAQAEVAQLEKDSHQVDVKAERLKKQLRTVIAVREAEALQHEITDCEVTRNAFDDKELVLLERQDVLTAKMLMCSETVQVETERLAGALGALTGAQGAVRREIALYEEQRSTVCLVIPAQHLSDYESKRKHISGGAVAELHGPTCQSCHLDIARGELDAMRLLPENEFAECPNCGCYLVI